ncbi:MAG: hypothetical protein LBR73_04450 [Oscillospiraceae bacterium]|jgi:hypothetical protein|nr:hypothetical protein [Oscillospiraceae bacterium]
MGTWQSIAESFGSLWDIFTSWNPVAGPILGFLPFVLVEFAYIGFNLANLLVDLILLILGMPTTPW